MVKNIERDQEELRVRIKENYLTPGLGIILVGNRKDSETYVRMKKAWEKIGIVNYDVI